MDRLHLLRVNISGGEESLNEDFVNISLKNSSSIYKFPESGEIPESFKEISETSRNCVIAYVFLFIMAGGGNISVFYSVVRQLRHQKSRITLLILHLSIADLMVTFFAMPLEIVWRITIQWYGGDVLCKLCQFFRAFGLYLSSMIVICISLDRYFAIIYPLKLVGAARRVKTTLAVAWISSILFATPQIFVFRVMRHPEYPSFHQCVTETFLGSDVEQELVYNVFSVSVLYFIPLITIVYIYSTILCKIYRKSKKHRDNSEMNLSAVSYRGKCPSTGDSPLPHEREMTTVEEPAKRDKKLREYPNNNQKVRLTRNSRVRKRDVQKLGLFLRKSTGGGLMLARAKIRTLRLTCVIVLTFVFCWTPYVVMTLWYMVDREGAKSVDSGIQEALFIMAVANSVVNPLIYGTYGSECRAPAGIKHCYQGHCYVPAARKLSHVHHHHHHTNNNMGSKRTANTGGSERHNILNTHSDTPV